MGYSGTWIGIKGKSLADIHQTLGLKPAPETEEYLPHAINALAMPNGWYLIFSGNEDLHSGPIPSELSEGCECVTFFGEEHVMVSAMAYWKDGHQVWSVQHESDKDIRHLEKQGDVPAFVEEIEARLNTEQDKEEANPGNHAVDFIYDVPLNAAEHLTGYNYNDEPEFDDEEHDPYHLLVVDLENRGSYFKKDAKSAAKAEGKSGCMILLTGVPTAIVLGQTAYNVWLS